MTEAQSRRSLREFLGLEAVGGGVLVVAAIAALGWANSPWGDSYQSFWSRELPHELGPILLPDSPQAWVVDGLIAVYFFVAGMELKRELTIGEMRDRRVAAFPAAGAIGGMLVPAAIYAALNRSGPGVDGWAIPMATDLAFALAALSIVGRGLSSQVRVKLLSLAIVDDVGSILVIAFFYDKGVEWGWLALAALSAVVVAAGYRLERRGLALVAVGAVALWLALFQAGVSASIAGVVAGVLAPATARSGGSTIDRLTHRIHPISTFVVAPLFALAVAGIVVSTSALRSTMTGSIGIGVLLGRVIGKPIGITLGCWVAVTAGVARRPGGVSWPAVVGVGVLGGMGFTVAFLVIGLGLTDPTAQVEAKLAVLLAAVAAGLVSIPVFAFARRQHRAADSVDAGV